MSTPIEFLNSDLILVPSEICKRKDAKQIWLWHNRLTYLPDKFSKLKKLKEVYLNGNQFSTFPTVLCGLHSLKILDLSSNKLSSLPSDMHLSNLSKLVLVGNQFQRFPEEVVEMKALEELYLGWNKLSALPACVSRMKKLSVLRVNNNEIVVIPEEVCQLESLREFNVSDNQVVSINTVMQSLLESLPAFCYSGNPCHHAAAPVARRRSDIIVLRPVTPPPPPPPPPPTVSMVTSPDNDDMYDCYKMDTDPVGIAVIINNVEFRRNHNDPRSRQLPDRPGSEVDAGRLRDVFQKLKFNVLPYQNLRAQDMVDVLKSISKLSHCEWSCLVVCVLSHGRQGEIAGIDGLTVTIKDLARPFTATNCPGLIRKPKLFFIQACQGESKHPCAAVPPPSRVFSGGGGGGHSVGVRDALPSEGVSIPESGRSGSRRATNETERSRGSSMESRNFGGDDVPVMTVPDEADFLYGLCTVPGYEAYRHPEPSRGSWYISVLVDVLEKCATTKHLLDILTEVNKDVAKEGNPDYKQMPAANSSLTKKVLFRQFVEK